MSLEDIKVYKSNFKTFNIPPIQVSEQSQQKIGICEIIVKSNGFDTVLIMIFNSVRAFRQIGSRGCNEFLEHNKTKMKFEEVTLSLLLKQLKVLMSSQLGVHRNRGLKKLVPAQAQRRLDPFWREEATGKKKSLVIGSKEGTSEVSNS